MKGVYRKSMSDVVQKDENLNMNQLLQQAGRTSESVDSDTNTIESAQHGDVVSLEDGTTGIIIDNEKEEQEKIKKLMAGTNIEKAANYVNGDDFYRRLFNQDEKKSKDDIGAIILEKYPNSDAAKAIADVKEAFKGVVPTATGIAFDGDPRAERFKAAREALVTGKVKLPTAEEYRKQKQELERKREEIIKMEQQNMTVQRQEMTPEPQVYNLAEAEEKMTMGEQDIHEHPPVQPPVYQPPVHVTTFKVPEGAAKNFVDENLTKEEREKVRISKEIVVEEQKILKPPTVTRKITSMDDYRRIPHREFDSEVMEIPLVNSGYAITVRGASSMEMSAILPDPRTMDWEDYPKLYEFCYNHMVSSSIGWLSYNMFLRRTSPYDLDFIIYTILRLSQPNECNVTLTCGRDRCRKDYDINYATDELIDTDEFTEETIARMNEIMAVRSNLDAAKELQEKSPVMTEKYVDLGEGKGIMIKHPDGVMVASRTDDELLEEINDKVGGWSVIFLFNTKSIYVCEQDENGEEQVYEVTDMMAMATEIQVMSDTQLNLIKNEFQNVKEYQKFTYSFKNGEDGIVCPHCRTVNKKVNCKIQSLVFHKVSKAIS